MIGTDEEELAGSLMFVDWYDERTYRRLFVCLSVDSEKTYVNINSNRTYESEQVPSGVVEEDQELVPVYVPHG